MNDISFTQNRELSWLKFNERVLEEAADKSVELFERVKFFSIFDTNFEEFFMVRVGSLTDINDMKKKVIDNKTLMSTQEQIDCIMDESKRLYEKKDTVYEDLKQDLQEENVSICRVNELDDKEKRLVYYYFNSTIAPILSFQIVDRVHPFPQIPNLAIVVLFQLTSQSKNKKQFMGLIQVPDKIKRYVKLSDTKVVLIEDIIREFGQEIFDNYDCTSKYILSVTRNADIEYDDEDLEFDDDYRSYMKKMIKLRKRLRPVRLEINEYPNEETREFLLKNLNLTEHRMFVTKSPMRCGFLFDLVYDMPKNVIKKYTYEDFSPQESSMISKEKSVIEQVYDKDLFLSFPYESIDPFIRLLNEAAEDESVVSIKITIYRLAKDSEITKALIKAAENGKEVVVLMELRARFDEENNILWSSRLENAGCRIIYGFDHYKCHSKVCLITKIKDEKISYITQVGTGNYNEKTSKLYTDFSYMTTRQEIGEDAKELFDNFLLGKIDGEYKHLMVSPHSMQVGLDKLIDEQIEKAKVSEDGYIRIKMNSISDRKLIDKLSKASCKGVKIDLMVRGICCLVPGIKDKTENINVYQVVGRFLEHHRIYQFGKAENCKLYISSADFMTRNIRKRVEVAVPIYDDYIKHRILNFMDIMFADDTKIRKLNSDKSYSKVENTENKNSQEILIDIAKENSVKRNLQSDDNRVISSHSNKTINPDNNDNKRITVFDKIKNFFKNLTH
ncbi:RNA degradosome polyphosphate kinase [Finegoldia magna]|uniref:Polyphosphate kinase n=1 Tax=Finegoldia magna (strain ATCC 29328 / DSM 20472 / WAL 2508) TaxID=334413 RepID=B0S0E1_FINM2|nr:RNA degradosome polyphosphate kinase [Finegoldia magna]UEA70780.1 RNA degradosome polyphosphate kinase [Finegoldia magna]BAG07859.1 polyphosphate kinase [Finegoldia magna ATCC 29328]